MKREKSNKTRYTSVLAQFQKQETEFKEVDLAEREHPAWMTRCFRNNKFIVTIDDNRKVSTGTAIVALVQNHLNTPIANHWSEMQRIKNEIFGENTVAIEYYPAQSMMIDRANIYWMWVFPDGVLPMPV